MPIDPQKLPEMSAGEFKDLTRNRRSEAIRAYRHRTGLSAEEAESVADHWQQLSERN